MVYFMQKVQLYKFEQSASKAQAKRNEIASKAQDEVTMKSGNTKMSIIFSAVLPGLIYSRTILPNE